jgi:hypothetical protein
MTEIKEYEITQIEEGLLVTNLTAEARTKAAYKWVVVYGWGGVVTQVLKNEAANGR